MIVLILLQRGRGGGLAGAFGGMGGQSAFGTKAGDVFTKITIYIATVWILLGCVCVVLTQNFKRDATNKFQGGSAAGVKQAPADEKNQDDEKSDSNEPGPKPEN